MTDNKLSNGSTAPLGLFLGLGIVFGAWILGAQIKATRLSDRYVTVKGLVERQVKSDLAIWPISSKEAGDHPDPQPRTETTRGTQAQCWRQWSPTPFPPARRPTYIFPVDNMPQIFQMLSKFIPATYMMEISRGVILRSAGLPELWLNALKLFASGVAVLLIAANRFRKMIV